MPGFLSGGIFLSYRREDAAPYARLLQFQLSERFPDARVFLDLDSIEAGLDFAEVIREAVESCVVLVALIGRQWATLVDGDGHRRLDAPDDYVRFEVQTALERGVRVVPVLVDGAKPLRPQQLASGLHELARLNALELSYGRYQYDVDRLLDLIQRALDAVAPARATRILIDAERAARSITDVTKVNALAEVAEALAATDPDGAARLMADAERAARSITDEGTKVGELARVAELLAATDPDGAARLMADAERAAQSITDKLSKAFALAGVVRANIQP